MSIPRMKDWPTWARWTRDIVLFAVVVAGIQWWHAQDMAKGQAPGLAGADVYGRPLALTSVADEGPVLVHFWASWCPICRFEEASIASIARDHQVLTVATTSGTPSELREYLAGQGLQMPVIVDESGDLARHWGVSGLPATFIIDSKGRIDYATRGYSSEWGLRLRLWLAG